MFQYPYDVYNIFYLYFFFVPGHAWYENGLQRQIGAGTLVSSQEQRTLLVPVINRSSTGRFVPATVYMGFHLFVLPKSRSGHLFSMFCRARGTVVSCANKPVGVPSCRARSPSHPAVRRPTRPARGVSGFWIRQVILMILRAICV